MQSSNRLRRWEKNGSAARLILLTAILGVALAGIKGCQGLPPNVANCPVVPTPFQEEIDFAFQMDGNHAQQPYNVWLDEVTLNAN